MSRGRRTPYQLEEVLKLLEAGRAGAIRVTAGSQPFKERYNKARAVTEAIDDLAENLTGERERFWAKPHG